MLTLGISSKGQVRTNPSTALTKVPNLSQGKEKEGEGKISSPSSSTEDPSTAPSKVLTQGENSGTSQSVTLAQVTDLLHAHVAETKLEAEKKTDQ